MDYQRGGRRERDTTLYSQEQVESVIDQCGIEVAYESDTHFIGYCPFHNNTDSPAFEVDKTRGLYTCFNPGCGASGNLRMLLEKIKGYNTFKATRCIVLAGDGGGRPITEILDQIKNKPAEFLPFPEGPVNRMRQDFVLSKEACEYMRGRGFSDETMDHFGVGYSNKMDMVVVPMHSPDGMLVGFIGRSISGKAFKNTDDLPKGKTAWNFHRAKAHDTVIIVESTFDAMRIHQAGYPNVVALLGGSLSPHHIAQIDKTFNTVIIMTDCEFERRYEKDKATGKIKPCAKCKRLGFHLCQGHRDGRELGAKIAKAFAHKKVLWAAHDDTWVYPHRAKDATDMTDDEIRQCLTNAVGNFVYSRWKVEDAMDAELAKV